MHSPSPFYNFILFVFLFLLSPVTFSAAEPPNAECLQALEDAQTKVNEKLSDSGAQLSTASAQMTGGSPLADLVNTISTEKQKLAEIEKQKLEQHNQINTQRYQQALALQDKEREILREKSKLPIEIKNAEFNLKKQETNIRIDCQKKAEEKFNALVETNKALAAGSQYTVNSLSKVRGSRRKLMNQRKVLYNQCLADPSTQEALLLAKEELDTKLYNFKIQSEITTADLQYNDTKRAQMDAHMNEQHNYVNQAANAQGSAVQSLAMNLIQLGMSLQTSGAGQQAQAAAAGTFNSVDAIINDFPKIVQMCQSPSEGAGNNFKVPSDLMYIFSSVNRICRRADSNPQLACITSSGQASVTPKSSTGANQ